MQKLNKKGFTLIELLVVIAIIGILASIMVVSLTGARSKANDAKRQSELNQLRTAMTLYYDDHNQDYPNTDCTSANTTTNGCVFATADGDNPLKPEYMAQPIATIGSLTYTYNYTAATPNAYVAYVTLEAPATTTYYCIDSTGKAEQTTSAVSGQACP